MRQSDDNSDLPESQVYWSCFITLIFTWFMLKLQNIPDFVWWTVTVLLGIMFVVLGHIQRSPSLDRYNSNLQCLKADSVVYNNSTCVLWCLTQPVCHCISALYIPACIQYIYILLVKHEGNKHVWHCSGLYYVQISIPASSELASVWTGTGWDGNVKWFTWVQGKESLWLGAWASQYGQ